MTPMHLAQLLFIRLMLQSWGDRYNTFILFLFYWIEKAAQSVMDYRRLSKRK